MSNEGFERRRTWRLHGCWPVIGAVAMTIGLGGCSSVPDAVNPVSWYEKTVDYFSGDKNKPTEQAQADQTAPGADKPFPNLGTVPPKPQVTPESNRQQIAQGLVADREQRKYAPAVSRQGAAVNALGNEPTPAAQAAMPPTPSPVPSLPPVASAPTTPVKAAAAPPPAASSSPPSPPRMALEPPPMPKTAGPAASSPAPREVPMRTTRPVPPAGATLPGAQQPFETVVVSSAGVENEQMAAAPAQAAPSPSFAAPMASTGPESLPPAGTENGSLKVATIQFAYGSSSLDARDRAILREVLKLQKERGGVIRVVGHASSRTANMDPVRHKMVNFQVSANRAQTVANALTDMGANPDSIVVAARSDADPVYYEFMPSGEAGNQRAEVYLDF